MSLLRNIYAFFIGTSHAAMLLPASSGPLAQLVAGCWRPAGLTGSERGPAGIVSEAGERLSTSGLPPRGLHEAGRGDARAYPPRSVPPFASGAAASGTAEPGGRQPNPAGAPRPDYNSAPAGPSYLQPGAVIFNADCPP